jgi:hypothetical protein
VLVLDEATSNIDAEAEKSIQEALAVLVRGRTTIAIAHRLSTLRNADRILAFDRGRLVEQGTHAELLAADGIYARLVRIQMQVSKQPTVDSLLVEDTTSRKASAPAKVDASANPTTVEPGPAPAQDTLPPPSACIQWLEPQRHHFAIGPHERIELWEDDSRIAAGLFVVRTFPATHPEGYLSVRGWGESGDEVELGMMRTLDGWNDADTAIVRKALARRSLVRTITRVHGMHLGHGYLDLDVGTDAGRQGFTMRWTQSQAVDFGTDGKMLIDTEDNRWVVRRVADLPKPDRERFLQYVYW